MSEDIRRAAQRIVASVEFMHQTVGIDATMKDCAAVARAWLSEHPADDDEAITEGWLLANGWHKGRDLFLWFDGVRVSFNGNEAFISNELAEHIRTKGDVRRLCSSLGNPLKY